MLLRRRFLLFLISVLFFIHILLPPSLSQSSNHSVLFNGTSSYVDVPYNANLNITGALTMEAWIKTSSTSYQHVLERGDWWQAQMSYDLVVAEGKVRMDIMQSSGSYVSCIGNTVMSAGGWHHIAGVYDGSQMRVYLDGVLDGTVTATMTPGNNTTGLRIGKSSFLYTPNYFNGRIDEVRVSNAAVYTSNFTPSTHLTATSSTKGLWKFDGQTANDSSGSGANGSLQAGAQYSTDVPTGANNAPTVSITDPLNNTNFAGGSNLVIDASAADSDGTVAKVEFFQGSTLLGTDSTPPYTVVWSNVTAGSYAITARATDDLAATATTTPITITVHQAAGDRSVLLNGTSSYVDVPYHANLNITGALTMEAWIKTTSASYQHVIERGDWWQNQMSYDLVLAEGKVRMDIMQTSGSYVSCIGNTVISSGVWHHIAGVYDGSQMRVYLDGVLDGTATATLTPGNNSTGLRIGKSSYLYYPNYFNGRIDEARISNAAIYTSTFTPNAHLTATSSTKGLWKFDGETTNDGSASGANGSLQGGATYSTDVPTGSGGGPLPVSIANGPYSGQRAQSISFSSSGSFDPNGTITAYHWNFGDGTSSNTSNPTHAYQTSGLFTATLTVTDNSGLLASATATVSVNGSSEARLDPLNATGGSGENPLSRNFNWTLPLVSLPGRAGLDLNLSLSYNSLVWTKKGPSISFDDDYGFPSPGFRLSFPTIQTEYLNAETGKWSYLLIGADGSRTELRRVTGSTVLYESADSAHLLLDTTALATSQPQMTLRTTDGAQLTYKPKGVAYECTEIKDRNGNYLTINYNSSGRIANIHDTLDRIITFVYENDRLSSIQQQWSKPSNPAQQISHTWASFAYTNVPIQTNFASGLAVSGPSSVMMLSKVTLDDNSTTASENSHYDFEYTSWGQVWKISNFAAENNHLLNYRSYRLPGSPLWSNPPAQADCPRFTERRDWAENWNQSASGAQQEAVTAFTAVQTGTANVPGQSPQTAAFVQVTNPDQTFNRIYFLGSAGTSSGWRVGLPYLVDSYDVGGTVPQRQVATNWTQDDESQSYIVNPRVVETNVYDPSGNRKRTDIQYQSYALGNGMSCQLPQEVREYASDSSTVLRTTHTIYIDDAPYLSRRIIGLPKESLLYEGAVGASNLRAKREYKYDGVGSIAGNDGPVQHDPAYSSSFVSGRGNLSTVKRYDVENLLQFTSSTMKYNTAGAVVSAKDALNNEVKVGYADSFSDNNNSRGTFAYPTIVIDPDNFYSTTKYNFDFGSTTYRQTPPPNATVQPGPSPTPVGPAQTFTYDDLGRLERTTSLVNNAYTRYQYPTSKVRIEMFSTLVANKGEAYAFKILDGFGRPIASASDHPATSGTSSRFDAQRTAYDVMGRVMKTSNPVETSAIGDDPAEWELVEGDAGTNWAYTQYTYDWKGRPRITTNTDGTTRTVTYEGCGCAGGEVITLNDEGTVVNGSIRTRQKKIYSDVLGRPVKSEVWNFEGTGQGGTGRALYSTTVTNYNIHDQATLVREFKGAAPPNYLTDLSCPTGTCQKTELSYDGYGRLQTKHVPEQQQNPYVVTSWSYNADDTVNTITDGRGAVTTYGYGTVGNNRRLIKTISHALSGSLPINVSFDYDAAGNRKSMSHSINGVPQDSCDYTYDELSRVTSEARHINALSNSATAGNYTIGYQYTLAGQVSSVTDPFGSTTNLNYDVAGRTESVTGSYGGTNHTYAGDIEYRAWGAVKRHGVKTIAYNNRLQPTQFRYFQYRYDYNYHPDGTLKHLTDLDDVVGSPSQVTFHYMSRDYGYDLAARISRVDATDNPIVNGGIVPAPFVGSYGYDEFNNLSSRGGHYALNPNTTDSATFADNKRTNTGWSYDADGRLLTSTDTATSTTQNWTYDAAGRQVGISEISSGTTTTNTVSYDGNGELLFESVTTPQSTKADYLIRSSVLGTVLTKLDAFGNKDITYVPTNGLGFPMQTKDFNGNPAVTAVLRDVTGLQEDGKAVDPFGAVIQNVQPPSGGSPPNMPFYGGTYGGVSWNQFTNANNYSSGCTLDGIRTTCQNALGQVGHGNAFVTSISTTGILSEFFNAGLGGLIGAMQNGYSGTYQDNRYNLFTSASLKSHVSRRNNNIGYFLPDSAGDWADVRWTATSFLSVDNLNLGPLYAPEPQNPVPLPSDLRDRVASRVNNPATDCGKFIKKVIDEAAKLKGKANSNDPLAIFNRIQNEGGFHLRVQKDSGNTDFTSSGSRIVYIKQVSEPDDPRYLNHAQNAYAMVALNEILHHAKDSGTYSDRTLARALFIVLSPAERDANPLPKRNDVHVNGRYLHNFLTGRCPSP